VRMGWWGMTRKFFSAAIIRQRLRERHATKV
jgi:hypothetical protein